MKKILFFTLFFFSSFIIKAQTLQVVTSKNEATYYGNENVEFLVSGPSGSVTYRFGYAGNDTGDGEILFIDDSPSSVFEEGQITLSSGQTITISPSSVQEGTIICEVYQNVNDKKIAVAVYNPFDVEPFESEPSDFESFWKSQVTLARAVTPNFQIIGSTNTGSSTTYSFKIASLEDDLYGYASVPNGTGTFPALIKFPPFGKGGIDPEDATTEENNVISISINIFKSNPSNGEIIDHPEDGLNSSSYISQGIDDKNTFYIKHAILGAINLIDYLYSSNVDPVLKFDNTTKIGLWGESQGGGFSLIVGGLDQFINAPNGRVGAISVSNPALCEHHGYTQTPKKGSGFPNWLANHGSVPQIEENVKYYDAVFFAKRYHHPLFMTVGYIDRVCPTSTNIPVLSQTQSTTTLMNMTQTEHSHPYDEWNKNKGEFFKIYLDDDIDADDLGHYINAGDDVNTNSSTVNLNGIVEHNGSPTSFVSHWEKVSGPSGGSANFTDPNSLSTQVSFSVNGTYILRLRAQDDYTINDNSNGEEEDSFYTLADYITITVGNTSSCNLSLTNSPSGNIDAAGDEFTFNINATQNWTASSSQSWLTLSSTTGSGNQAIDVDVDPNPNTNIRTAVITVTCGGDTEQFTVTQDGMNSNPCGGANVPAEWELIGTYLGHEYYKPDEEASTWQEAQNLCLAAGGYLVSIEDQDEKNFIDPLISGLNNVGLNQVDERIFYIGLKRGSDNVFRWVSTNEALVNDGTVYDYDVWESNEPGSSPDDFVTLRKWSATYNPIKWGSENGLASRTFICERVCAPVPDCDLSLSNYPVNNLGSSVGTFNFDVNANAGSNWSISSSQNWLTFTPESGQGDQIVQANYSENNDGIVRSAIVTVTCGGDTEQFTISQEPVIIGSTCTDGVQNGDETGVDCGGPVCPECPTNGCTTYTSDCNNALTVEGCDGLIRITINVPGLGSVKIKRFTPSFQQWLVCSTWTTPCNVNDVLDTPLSAGTYEVSYKLNGEKCIIENVIVGQSQLLPSSPNGNNLTETFKQERAFNNVSDFSIYPNPTNNELFMNLSSFKGDEVNIQIFNYQGNLVKGFNVTEVDEAYRLDTSNLSSGIYNISVKLDGKWITNKSFVIQK